MMGFSHKTRFYGIFESTFIGIFLDAKLSGFRRILVAGISDIFIWKILILGQFLYGHPHFTVFG